MDQSIIVEPKGNSVVWRLRRGDSSISVFKEFEKTMEVLHNQAFVFLIDLCRIRYILPTDKKIIFEIINKIESYQLIELAYLADYRNYHRMRLLISLNRLPYEELVFKYEADALEYLNVVALKHFREENKKIKKLQ